MCWNCEDPVAHGCLCWPCLRLMLMSAVASAFASATVACLFNQ